MAKEIVRRIKLQIEAGKATPAPPVGTVLGPAGINLQEFCSRFNEATKDRLGEITPCEISLYDDRSYDFILKTPPAAFLIKRAAKIQKGSVKGANHVVAIITKDELKKIAEIKLPDLNAYDVATAMNIVEGTARNMGVAIKGLNDAELAEQEAEAIVADAEAAKREAELAKMEEEVQHEHASAEVEVISETKEDDNEEKAAE